MTKSRGIRVPRGTRPRWVAENQGRHLCACGCDEPVTLRPEHFPTALRFIHGHNPAVTHVKPKPPTAECDCGCGQMTTPGKRFRAGHNGRGKERPAETRAKQSAAMLGTLNPQYGKRAPNFKGRIYHGDGYVLLWAPEHPFASNGRVFEHRLVVEQHLRETDPGCGLLLLLGDQLYLRPDIEVHHLDEVKDNNAVENLLPLTKSEHATLHYGQRTNLRNQRPR